jgi:uncharacterized membrane protein
MVNMVDAVIHFVNGFNPYLAVFILAVAPIVELRAALPVGIGLYHLPFWEVLPLVILGNMIPAFLILYFWDWIIENLSRISPPVHQFILNFQTRIKGKSKEKINLYGPIALIFFVAIPLPGSGVWTGALIAWLFNLPKKRSLLAIFFGVVLAALAVAFVTYTGLSYV